ncbi:MAG: hypothetical protein TECD_01205 [Hyphomicrobiaceae bacterium hypho_1]
MPAIDALNAEETAAAVPQPKRVSFDLCES